MHFQCGSLKNNIKCKIHQYLAVTDNTIFSSPCRELMALEVDRAYQIFIKIPRAGRAVCGIMSRFSLRGRTCSALLCFGKQSCRMGAAVLQIIFVMEREIFYLVFIAFPNEHAKIHMNTHIIFLTSLLSLYASIPHCPFFLPLLIHTVKGEGFLCLNFPLQVTQGICRWKDQFLHKGQRAREGSRDQGQTVSRLI